MFLLLALFHLFLLHQQHSVSIIYLLLICDFDLFFDRQLLHLHGVSCSLLISKSFHFFYSALSVHLVYCSVEVLFLCIGFLYSILNLLLSLCQPLILLLLVIKHSMLFGQLFLLCGFFFGQPSSSEKIEYLVFVGLPISSYFQPSFLLIQKLFLCRIYVCIFGLNFVIFLVHLNLLYIILSLVIVLRQLLFYILIFDGSLHRKLFRELVLLDYVFFV